MFSRFFRLLFLLSVPTLLVSHFSLEAQKQGSGAIRPTALKTEYTSHPLGLEVRQPRLSWALEAVDPIRRGLRQVAYQILVASTAENIEADRGDMWDSGKVVAEDSLHIPYAGRPLKSRAAYWWKVRVWDQEGRASNWSHPAKWEMGLLEPSDWEAKWIEDATPVEADHNGYLSKLETSPEVTKWVLIDLLQSERIDTVKLYPANPIEFTPKRPGYLFPVRFRIDVSEAPDFKSFKTVVDQTKEDFPNPGSTVAEFNFEACRGRYVRVLVTRLADNGEGRFGFALAEMEVLKFQNTPPFPLLPLSRAGATLRASDSVEQSAWSLKNLNDAVLVSQKRHAGAPAPASMMRKSFELNQTVTRARAYVSALGVYELRINGKRVGKNILAPEWTDYNHRVQYQTFDVTEMLHQRENVIAATLGEGWYAGRTSFLAGRRHYGNKPKLIVQLEIELSDRSKKAVVSDESWKSTPDGPIRSVDIFDGEVYDARKELPGWDQAGFDDSAWKSVAIANRGKVKLVSQYNEPVQVTQEVKPIAINEPAPGVYVVDMGQNMVGWLRMRLRGPAGTRVQLRHAEVLKPDGNIYNDNLRQSLQGAAATDVYFLRGSDAEEVFEPHFTYHGFRYVEVTGLPYKPSLDAFTGRVIHSAAPRTGTFETSDSLLNKLMDNILWTQRGNVIGIPTDCPQRAERAGWMGDAQVFSQTAIFNMNMARFFTKWLQDIRDAQSNDGQYSAFAPNPFLTLMLDRSEPGWIGANAPGWSDAGVIIPWVVYVNYADKRLLEEHFESAVRYVESIRKANPDLIWREARARGPEFGDWVNGDTLDIVNWPRRGAATPMDLFATAFFAHSSELLAKIAKVLGREKEAKEYSALAAQIKDAFQREFVRADDRLHARGIPEPALVTGAGYPTDGDNQTSYALALHFNLLPENLRRAAVARMVENIKKYNWCVSTGIQATHRMMLELARWGYSDVAYRLLLNRKVPSWGYMIDHEATTIWERWDGYVQERGYQTPLMNSFNHYAFGAVGEWMYRNIAGINPDPKNPGYKQFTIRPHPGGKLRYAKATYDSIRGRIESAWRTENGVFHLNVTVPVNTTATVYVPAEDVSQVNESERPARQAEGVEFLRMEEGAAVFQIGSGQYEFKRNLADNAPARID